MSDLLKKIAALLVIAVIILGGFMSFKGVGSIDPLKDQIQLGLDIKGGVYVVMEAQTDLVGEELNTLMDQTRAVIEERVDQMGLLNPVVTIEGKDRIRVELPGAEDAEAAIAQIGKTAQLKFTLADGTFVLDGSSVKDAVTQQDTQNGGYAVGLKFDSDGAKAFEEATVKALSGTVVSNDPSISSRAIIILLDGKVISAPEVQEVIAGGECEISGGYTQDAATSLSALIRGGALPVELQEITSSVQTAKVGLNALEMSIYAGAIGFIIVFLVMLFGYRIMGLAANIALCLYVLLMLATMILTKNVLTLPGMAGIIVSIGMAVDANVIIFSRIKEEIANGKSIRVATQSGFHRALSTIIDSQLTTFIAAIILYQVGTSAVKGFALTLMIGIFASVFTAVIVTQLFLSIVADTPSLAKNKYFGMKEDGTPMLKIEPHFHFIKHRKIYYIVSILLISTGLLIGGIRGFNYGIDFTGGTMLHLNMGEQVAVQEVKDVFEKYDIDTSQMEIVFSGDKLEEIIIKTREALDNEQRKVIINDMEETFGIVQDDVLGIELFGPSVGKELQSNAIKAILLASIGMLLYMRFRFREWKFGGAALLGVLHDVLLVIAFYAVFQITVNNPFIAGILTVLGYSINDTIVIFDRVRENLHLMKKDSTEVILDTSVNQTISRSVMTGLNAILIMIPLYIMTGPAIREFVLPLMVGISVGTLSSIFVCSPLYYDFSNYKKKTNYQKHAEKSKKKNNYLGAESKKAERLPENEVKPILVSESEIFEAPDTVQTIQTETTLKPKTGPVKTTKQNKKGKKNKR